MEGQRTSPWDRTLATKNGSAGSLGFLPGDVPGGLGLGPQLPDCQELGLVGSLQGCPPAVVGGICVEVKLLRRDGSPDDL